MNPEEQTPIQPTADDTSREEVTNQVAKKKLQAKELRVVAIIFLLLALAGIVFVLSSLSTEDNEPTLTVDEQLMQDVNAFGLGVINFRNGNDYFELTPEKSARLRVGYLPVDYNDPRTSNPYVLTTAIPAAGEIQYVIGGVCEDDDSIRQTGLDSNFAIRVLLESGLLHCIEKAEVTQPTQS